MRTLFETHSEGWDDAAVFLALLSHPAFLVNCRDSTSGSELARHWLCQVVGGVVIHSAASLILLCGGFPCQEAPTWPSAHQPHLAPAYWRPSAHALVLRVGGESRLAGLGTDPFWQELLSPHSAAWSANRSAEHKRPEASITSSCGLQGCVEMFSMFLETYTLRSTVTSPHFIVSVYDFPQQSLTLISPLCSVRCDLADCCKRGWLWSSIDSENCLLCGNEMCWNRWVTHSSGHNTWGGTFSFQRLECRKHEIMLASWFLHSIVAATFQRPALHFLSMGKHFWALSWVG